MLLLKVFINTIETNENDFHARLVRKCIERSKSYIGRYYIQIYELTSPLTSEEKTILTALQARGVIASYTVEEMADEDNIA